MLINNIRNLDSEEWSSPNSHIKNYKTRINVFSLLVLMLTIFASICNKFCLIMPNFWTTINFFLILDQKFPFAYYLYNLMPIYLWRQNLLQ
jgi:hypothetical protein